MKYALEPLNYDLVWINHVRNGEGNSLGEIIKIDGDYFVVYDGRFDEGGYHYEDVWLVLDSNIRKSIFLRDSSGVYFWDEHTQFNYRKMSNHPAECVIVGKSIKDAIVGAMQYWDQSNSLNGRSMVHSNSIWSF